jgi:hypothetical protein
VEAEAKEVTEAVSEEMEVNQAHNMEHHRLNTVHHNSNNKHALSESSWRTQFHRFKSLNTDRNHHQVQVHQVVSEDTQAVHQPATPHQLHNVHQATMELLSKSLINLRT